MVNVSIDTSELRRLAADFDAGGRRVERLARAAVRKTGFDVLRDAKALIRQLGAIDTGDMINSMSLETTNTSSGLLVEIGPTVDYGQFVHDGTSRMGPRPYLTPPFDARVPELQTALEAIAAGVV